MLDTKAILGLGLMELQILSFEIALLIVILDGIPHLAVYQLRHKEYKF